MERLTRRRDGCTYIVGCPDFALPKIVGLIIQQTVDRLAVYEDTELEPDTISKIRDIVLDISGNLDRLRELAQADKEGRCVVLPAKVDQIIYQWRKGDACPSVSCLNGVQIDGDGEITYPFWGSNLTPEDFGKTVFLTRTEAESALRREQDE